MGLGLGLGCRFDDLLDRDAGCRRAARHLHFHAHRELPWRKRRWR